MTKTKLKFLSIVVVIICVGMGGCKKCYNCYGPRGTFMCHKAGDTVFVITGHGRSISDSLNYYHNKGYVCDTFTFFYTPDGFYSNPTCGKNGYNTAMENQDICDPA